MDYTKIINNLKAKRERQEAALAETNDHIKAIEELQKTPIRQK